MSPRGSQMHIKEKMSFQTVLRENGNWRLGASVHVVEGGFLATDRNAKKEDNLENLPAF